MAAPEPPHGAGASCLSANKVRECRPPSILPPSFDRVDGIRDDQMPGDSNNISRIIKREYANFLQILMEFLWPFTRLFFLFFERLKVYNDQRNQTKRQKYCQAH
ncbi:MAG: hypothetical protein ACU0A6_10490 [Shimia sp.]|uniref:hypothetical protein n=1 Tax=Shimia sp. TaxID=1954381 RepID=UPI00405935EC